MMRKLINTCCIALLAFGLTMQAAEAKRLGGGKSIGMQRDSAAQRQAAPPASSPQQAAPAPQTPTPAAQPPKRNWLGPIAGLAAGIGLAALLSHFGFGEGLANFVMIALLVFAAIFVLRLLFRRPAPSMAAGDQGMQYAGVGGPHMAPIPRAEPLAANVEPAASQPVAARTATLPPDFDVAAFVRVAKVQFIRMQAAHDAGNLADIREFTTPEMFAEIKLDIDERGSATQHTEVINVEAEVLEVVTESSRHIASVRFHGTMREAQGAPVEAFDEVWNLVKPLQGGGWILAGVQQLN